ncbi:hypothetical protein KJ761_02455, partial [Patescibacteria group bacterium]|nr:hypothetical protein [Patescibacteria group bacterium]
MFYYIREVVPSVKELLPTYGYLYDVENNESLLEYPANYPFNNFLDNLNSQTEKEKLLQVELSKIIGNVNDSNSTITGFKVIKTDMGDYWEHGYPHGFEIPLIGDGGMINGYGDQTVPLESAKSENIFSDNLIEINASHRELPTEAQEDIIEILTGIRPINKMEDSLIRDILFVSVFSPIDIQVIDPNNKKVGKDFTTGEIINEIEGAYYSGSGTENEFLTIPNPVDGEYKILTQGTGDGAYKIEATKITEDPDTGIAGESTATISGTATPGQEEEKEVTVEGNNVTTGNQDTVPPTITGSVTVQPNAKGWYNSDVTVHFEATDDESGIDFVTPDVIITTEGKNQSVTGIAKDKAGNEASFTVSGINIDKTAPEVKIIFNQVSQKLDVLGVDDLSQNVSVVMGERAVNQEPEIKKGKFSWLLDKIKKGKKEKKKK